MLYAIALPPISLLYPHSYLRLCSRFLNGPLSICFFHPFSIGSCQNDLHGQGHWHQILILMKQVWPAANSLHDLWKTTKHGNRFGECGTVVVFQIFFVDQLEGTYPKKERMAPWKVGFNNQKWLYIVLKRNIIRCETSCGYPMHDSQIRNKGGDLPGCGSEAPSVGNDYINNAARSIEYSQVESCVVYMDKRDVLSGMHI